LGAGCDGVDKQNGCAVTHLHLHLNAEYFDQIRSGHKLDEYRLQTRYWSLRLAGRDYAGIVLHKGYPKAGDDTKIMMRPWAGCTEQTITHVHFGAAPVRVFAIRVN
jgi:hypothetical protein